MTKTTRNILLIAAATLLLVTGAGLIALRSLLHSFPPDETTNPVDYANTLKQWSPTTLVSHFPPTIPANATNIHFSTFPGFLQGGAWIQLRIQLPPDEIRSLESDFTKQTKRIYTHGGEIFTHLNEGQTHNLPTTNFYTADNPKSSTAFPPDYTFYVLKSRNAGNWNHGHSTGVVISTEKKEIIYWADQW
jgi:hypothetical protein